MKVARWIIRTTLLLLSCCAPATFVLAQSPTQQSDVVKVNTELVQTDFTVFDKQGSFVDGLKRDQFTLKVEGKSRDITFFDRVAAGSRNEEAQLAAARGAPGKGTAVPLDRGRIVMFFLDDLHLSLSSLNRTRDLLKRFIDREMGQNDLAEIVSTSGQLGFLQQLTDNKSVLTAAADRLHYTQMTPGGSVDTPPMSEYHALLIEQGDEDVLGYFVDYLFEQERIPKEQAVTIVKGRASALLKDASSISTRSMTTFQTWMKQTAVLPGRKLVFFISDGFLLDKKTSDNYTRLQEITLSAARSGIVIYSIDSRGLATGQPEASSFGNPDPFARLARAAMGEMRATQDVLSSLAADTGGRAFFNNNNLSNGVTTALKETSVYYLLAWRPDNDEQRNPKYRRIEVAVMGHPDWTVRFRRASGPVEVGQSATSKEQPAPDPNVAAAKINRLLRAPYPESSLPVAITLNFVDTAESGLSLTTSIDVQTTSLTLEPLNGITTGLLDVGGAILNDEGKSVTIFNKRFTIRGPADPTVAKPPERILYNQVASIKPGLYQVRVAAIDAKRGTSGSAHGWIEIPDLQSKKLALSTLIVSEKKEDVANDSTGGNLDNAPTSSPLAKIVLNVRHRFAQSSSLRFFTFVYNATFAQGADAAATTSPDLAVTVQVFRDNEPVITTPLHPIATEGAKDLQRIPYGADVALNNLSSGAYVLQVTVIDRRAKASAMQRFSFQIE
ncbi:MAG TPA: VWA domain-containing protein [Pyrinomonadaceae bacterium]|nr:VWA domain-containing protein [Pyrinomonadaceae bacterium]